jgi:hypothetical protein
MNLRGFRLFPFIASSILAASLSSAAFASADRDNREVRVSFVQGDVRLSRGDGKHIDLRKDWEEAQSGQLIEKGFAVSTGAGCAEIEFEDGSTVYLAENSLLVFNELSSTDDRLVTRVTLATGSASFRVQPAADESFSIETATDRISPGPHGFFLRVDAYLDSTGVTPLGSKVENIVSRGLPNVGVRNGRTVFFRNGEVLSSTDFGAILRPEDSGSADSAQTQQLRKAIEKLRDSGVLQTSVIPQDFFGLESFERQASPAPQSENADLFLAGDAYGGRRWDRWVEAREQARQTTMDAALKASGLTSPVPGIAELYRHGTFFSCEPYGTCWEPKQSQSTLTSDKGARQQDAQAPGANPPATGGFQPQTVQWQETDWGGGYCDFSGVTRTITRVANTPEELRNLLRLKAKANSNGYFQSVAADSCYSRPWLFHHGHYAMVLPKTPPPCSEKDCKPVHPVHPVHPPRPLFVRVGNRVGFVPSHPDDVKGNPPINLKNGIILAPSKPGEATQRIAWDPSQKFSYVEKPPREFRPESSLHSLPVAAPQIHGHLMQEASRGNTLSAASQAVSQITYDYKSQKFMMPAAPGAKEERVAVGGIASNGRVESFASDRSGRYAESFSHTSAAASYSGGSNSGSHSFGSGSSSGSSGGSSGGSSRASSGGGSSGGSFSHSSGGSSGGSSSGGGSSSASTASSSSSGGGRPH